MSRPVANRAAATTGSIGILAGTSTGVEPDKVKSAIDLADDYERRMRFQADFQSYVDMSISSTINLPAYGTQLNNNDTVADFSATLAKYAPRLRGFTVYPDWKQRWAILLQRRLQRGCEQTGQRIR